VHVGVEEAAPVAVWSSVENIIKAAARKLL